MQWVKPDAAAEQVRGDEQACRVAAAREASYHSYWYQHRMQPVIVGARPGDLALRRLRRSLRPAIPRREPPGALLHGIEGLSAQRSNDPAFAGRRSFRQAVVRFLRAASPRRPAPRRSRHPAYLPSRRRRRFARSRPAPSSRIPSGLPAGERTHDRPARALAGRRVLAARIALVGLADAELLAREQAGIRLQGDAGIIERQQRGDVDPRGKQPRRAFMEHERDRRVDELHRARRARGQVGRPVRVLASGLA